MDRSSRFLVRKVLVDFLCVFVVGMVILMFYLFGKPYERGFFCNDESLSHPFHESTVTSSMLYVIGLILPIATMFLLEFNYCKSLADKADLTFLGYNVPHWMTLAYAKIGTFGFGAALTVLTTDVAKYSIGRLRPHFMTLCKPRIDCSQPENQHRYIEEFECQAPGVSARLLKELRLSFPSGHSSFSAYTMVYLALYLQLRLTWKGSKLIKHFLQFICIMMAWYTAMTRVSNYKHHWSDVLAGSSIGTIIAFIVAYGIADLFNECQQSESRNKEKLDKVHAVEYEAAASSDSTQVNNGTGNRIC